MLAKRNTLKTTANNKPDTLKTAAPGSKNVVGRFAPSPTGRMHAGNIFAYLMAWLCAKACGGKIVLRIEDIDTQRSKPEFAVQIQRDLELLGLEWDGRPMFQHNRNEAYAQALEVLKQKSCVYPCFCSRASLRAASAPHGAQANVYMGTCYNLSQVQREEKLAANKQHALRLHVPSKTVAFHDLLQGSCSQNLETECGDFIVRRADGAFAYQLACVVDDAAQGVTQVVRGVDLISSTPRQIHLQQLLGLKRPAYLHIPLFVDTNKTRLAKRNASASLDEMLARHKTPAGVIGHIAYTAGLIDTDEPADPQELLKSFRLDNIADTLKSKTEIVWEG